MTARVINSTILKGNAHFSDYKKSLSSTYAKKGIWEYLSKQRVLLFKNMKK